MPKKTQIQSNGFCYTIPNYTDNHIAYCMSLFEDDSNCKYQVIGFEVCPRTRTKHIQGYIYYTQKLDLNKVIQFFNIDNVQYHVEAQKSKTNVAAYAYCFEDRDYYEQGERPRQGHRTDLEVIKHDLLDGRPMKDIAFNYFSQWCQYRRAFDAYLELNAHSYSSDDCLIVTYDDVDIMPIFAYIHTNLKDFYISTEYLSWADICKMKFSCKYKYIFIPALGLYRDYIEYTIPFLDELGEPNV